MDRQFAQLSDSRVNESFSVLQRVARWVQSQGRRQRISKTSFGTYLRWQAEGANYIVTEADQIIGLVTLRREPLEDWPDFAALGVVWMLRALATDPDHRGRGVGAFAVRQAIAACEAKQPIYLDCVTDFLPGYYAKLGFESIARQDRVYCEDETYDITLMRYVPELL